MHHATPLITTIVGGLVLAFILGMLANKLRVSPLVGYLLAGVLTGPFTLGFIADTKLASELAELGVILLVSGVSLHFSLKGLMAVKTVAIPGAIAQITVAALLGMAFSTMLGQSLMTGIVLGLCLSTASTVVLLRALEERQLIDNQRGQITIGWLTVEDLVMVLTPVLLPAVTEMMERDDMGFATLVADMGVTIGKVITFIAIMMLVGHRLIPWIMACNMATGPHKLSTLSVLALALGVAFGAVELFNVPFALNAFFAGMVLNESELSHRAAHDTLPLRGAFTVLLFVSVGMLFDPLILIQQPLAVLMALAIILFGKSLAIFFLVRLPDHSQRTALAIAASLAQIGGFAFILAGLGMALNLLSQTGQSLVLAGTILSTVLNPVLFALLEKYLTKIETLEERTLEEAIEEEKQTPVDTCNYALLVGYGRVGSLLGEKLLASDIPLVVIETSQIHVNELREHGTRAVLGNAMNEGIMQPAHLECAKWLILTVPNDYEAGKVVASARAKNPSTEIIARAHYDDEVAYTVEHGANQVVIDEREIAHTILELLETPPAGEVMTG